MKGKPSCTNLENVVRNLTPAMKFAKQHSGKIHYGRVYAWSEVLPNHQTAKRFIYFIQCLSGGPQQPILIGETAQLRERIGQIKNSLPFPIKVVGLMVGTVCQKNNIAESFEDDWIHGQWFNPSDGLLGLINNCATEFLGV